MIPRTEWTSPLSDAGSSLSSMMASALPPLVGLARARPCCGFAQPRNADRQQLDDARLGVGGGGVVNAALCRLFAPPAADRDKRGTIAYRTRIAAWLQNAPGHRSPARRGN